jgi:hypothetical protein
MLDEDLLASIVIAKNYLEGHSLRLSRCFLIHKCCKTLPKSLL